MKDSTVKLISAGVGTAIGIGLSKKICDYVEARRFRKQLEDTKESVLRSLRRQTCMTRTQKTELDDMLQKRKEEGEKRLKELREEMEGLHTAFMETDDVDVMLDITKRRDELIKELRENL